MATSRSYANDDASGRVLMGVVQRNVRVCAGNTEAELLHTYSRVDPLDILILCVRLAVLVAVTLTVPVVLFPVSLNWSLS